MIDDLPNWWTYRVRVTARNERGPSSTNVSEYKSAPSAEATDQTRDTDLWAAPNPVEAVAGDEEVMVKWTAVEDATGYRVQWRTASQSYDSSRQHDGFYQYRSGNLQLNHTVDELENGTEYMFRVFAKFGDGDMSRASDEVKATPMDPAAPAPDPDPEPTAPAAAPGAVEATAGDAMVTVSWQAVEGATKYMVEWRTASQTYGAAARQASVTGTTHSVEGLENGMEYMLRVKAGNDAGYGPASDEVTATPMMPTPALPLFGALALGAGLVAAGRRRLRARQRRLLNA